MKYFRSIRLAALLLLVVLFLGCRQLSAAPLDNDFCEQLEIVCKTLEGAPYVWGGTKKSGTDCSGAIYYIAKRIGQPIPRTTSKKLWIITSGQTTHWNKASCGYLVWWQFSPDRPYGHVGIIVEDTLFWQAGSSTGFVKRKFMEGQYWDRIFKGSKEFFN